MASDLLALPQLSLRTLAVWRRNFLVWRKLAIPSLLGNLADPLIYMVGLGYGLGQLVPEVAGGPYIAFLAAGTVSYSTMNSATFEALYSGFSRMHVQKTWEAIMNAPVSLDDIVLAEILWACTKALFSGTAILLVVGALGYADPLHALWALPVLALTGLTFAALGMAVTAVSPSYDFFMYYFTLLLTPMALVSGVFFPAAQLPPAVAAVAEVLPLAHVVQLIRPLLAGQWPVDVPTHVAVLLAYALLGFVLAVVLARRRLLK